MRKTATFNSALTFVLALFHFFVLAPANAGMPSFDPANAPAAPSYENPAAWLALPDSDLEHPVDIFWVYPTVLFDDQHWLMPPTDAKLHAAAADTLRTQASVFSGQANLFAPLYRQMNMAALSLPENDMEKVFTYGKADILKAFRYYVEHLNQGRPFILAGHSQGSNLLAELAIQHWGTFGVESNLVAAYLIGWSITPDDLKTNPRLAICQDAEQTGCFIAYNTVAPGKQPVAPTLKPGTMVVNPLSWKTDGSPVPATRNKGALFFQNDGTTLSVPHFTGAQIVDHGLVIAPDDTSPLSHGKGVFPQGVYHLYDYSIFYENLRHNAGQRIRSILDN